MLKILQFDETESGFRIRKTLAELHGIQCELEQANIGGVFTTSYTEARINLYRYTRITNGEDCWIVEASMFYPPDIELFRSWVVGARPTTDQIRQIVADTPEVGATV